MDKSKLEAIKKLKNGIKKAGSKEPSGAPQLLITLLMKKAEEDEEKKRKKKKGSEEEVARPVNVLGGE